jgi:hypothetical protein
MQPISEIEYYDWHYIKIVAMLKSVNNPSKEMANGDHRYLPKRTFKAKSPGDNGSIVAQAVCGLSKQTPVACRATRARWQNLKESRY